MKTALSALLGAAALTVALSACTTETSGHAVPEAGSSSSSSSSSPSTKTTKTTTKTTTAPKTTTAKATTPKFGQTFVYDDGITVTISAPTAFTPSSTAIPSGPGKYVTFEVTIVNGSPENYNPNMITLSAQSGNTEADRVFDTAKDIGSPTTTVLPNRQVTFKAAFKVENPTDLIVQIAPSFDHEDTIFTN